MPRPIDLIPGFAPERSVKFNEESGGWIITVKPPPFMHLPPQSVELTRDQYLRYLKWRAGAGMVQDALPDLTAGQREILMSGIGDEDFAKLAADDEE